MKSLQLVKKLEKLLIKNLSGTELLEATAITRDLRSELLRINQEDDDWLSEIGNLTVERIPSWKRGDELYSDSEMLSFIGGIYRTCTTATELSMSTYIEMNFVNGIASWKTSDFIHDLEYNSDGLISVTFRYVVGDEDFTTVTFEKIKGD
jgi:hypothetical protein